MRARRSAAAARTACGLAAIAALAACDLGPLGRTALRGEPAQGPLRDWSALEPAYSVAIQTHAPAWLPAADVRFVVYEGTLWLYAMTTPTHEYPWLRRLRDERPGVTIAFAGRLHEARATRVDDPQALEPLLPLVLRKYHGVEAARARFAPPSARHPDTRIRHWFFRVDPPDTP
jgi:hypothetical protein